MTGTMVGGSGQAAGRRVVLHIGMNKAGSTSLQKAFAGYRDARFEYAGLGAPNHSHLLSRCFMARPRAKVFDDPARRDAEAEASRDALAAALDGTPRSAILSGEDLWTNFAAEDAGRCAAFLRARAGAVEGLAYVRGPAAYARSVFQQRLKKGVLPFDPGALVPTYRARVARWDAALGGAGLACVPFDRAALKDGDVVVDFAARLGLDEAWARERAGGRNESLSAEATAVLFLHRALHGGTDLDQRQTPANIRLVAALRGFGSRRYAFAPLLLAPALAARAADIAWMEERLGRAFPPDEPGDAVVWGSEAELVAFAEAQAAPLAGHLRAQGLLAPGARTTAALLAGLQALTAEPPRRAGPLRRAAARLGRGWAALAGGGARG